MPLGLEVSLSHSSPLPQVSERSLTQHLHALSKNGHDGAPVPLVVQEES